LPFKKFLKSEQTMSSVELAADYANRMIEREAHRVGGTEEAMRRVEATTGIGYWTLWSLRYRRRDLKTIAADQFTHIRNAYLATCRRQLAALQHEIEVEEARCGNDAFDDLATKAERLAARLRGAAAAARPGAPTDLDGEGQP
jgi:hypothetical protein